MSLHMTKDHPAPQHCHHCSHHKVKKAAKPPSTPTAPQPDLLKQDLLKHGLFYMACLEFPASNPGTETECTCEMALMLYQCNPPLNTGSCHHPWCAALTTPLLAIHQDTNKAIILHGILVFIPPLGMAKGCHPANGTTLAFIGDPSLSDTLPPLVSHSWPLMMLRSAPTPWMLPSLPRLMNTPNHYPLMALSTLPLATFCHSHQY